ncbi:MAG TPA: molybdopterin cofactor-binding domain-containing protein [Myxococcota bacterium]|nr:molybdopterin cofactor-binding domain-containing protein [Myxococcota bacterium]
MSPLPSSLARHPELDLWIRIDPADTITLFTGKVELGQGLRTAIARIGAEELDVSLERIRVATADTRCGPNEFFTAGSQSMEDSGAAMRQASAEARAHLLARAAERLRARVDDLVVEDGTVSVRGGGARVTYWQLFGGRRFGCAATGEVPPKDPGEYRVVGRAARRVDLVGLVTGTTRYVHDLVQPGMLHARVLRPPSPGAALASLDDMPVRAIPGVVAIVRDGTFVGVVAEREEQAVRALCALRESARWRESESLPPEDRLSDWLAARPARSFRVEGGVAGDGSTEALPPDPRAAFALTATYTRPYQMHASIGPSAAMALWRCGALTVWSHTQGVHPIRAALAQALGIAPDAITVVHVEGPGCYGHNGADDAAFDAALISRSVPERPVLLKWMRDDEHAWEPYGPAAVVEVAASVDASGRILHWSHDTRSNTHLLRALPYGDRTGFVGAAHREAGMPFARPQPATFYHAGIHRNADPLYSIPRRRIVKHFVDDTPLRTSALRSLGAYVNVFAIESFMDELAAAAGADPVAFRLRHLDDPRARAVLAAAVERSGFAHRTHAPGRGTGIGFARYKNQKAYAAVAVEARVDRASGAIALERVVIAADAGQIVDPSGLANQLEGGVVQSASWTIKESVRFDRVRVTSLDWESYPILRFPEVPELETILIDRPGEPYLGSGEAAQGPTAAAIANAVFDAIGVRLRDIPFTPERVRAAL